MKALNEDIISHFASIKVLKTVKESPRVFTREKSMLQEGLTEGKSVQFFLLIVKSILCYFFELMLIFVLVRFNKAFVIKLLRFQNCVS